MGIVIARRPGRLVVRVIAKPELVVAADRDFSRAPRLKGAHQYRCRKRGPYEQGLLKRHALDRPEGAKQGDQKRNWEDRGHSREALE